MTLRVSGRGHQGREVRIRSPKCTVGSAPGCTLRLMAPGVGPLHCWIFRGPGGAVVRRVHGPATLNGGRLEEASLKVGDRLRIGSVELELLDLAVSTQEIVTPTNPESPTVSAEAQELRTRLADALDRVTRLETESRQGFQGSITAAERADQLSEALTAAHAQLAETCCELASAQEVITNHKNELASLRANEGKSAGIVEQVRSESAAAAAKCTSLVVEIGQAREQRRTEQERWDSERGRLERELAQCEQKIKSRDVEIESLRTSAGAQPGAMTVALDESRATENSISPQAQSRIAELEQQLRASQDEAASLGRQVAEQEVVQIRLDTLTAQRDCLRSELELARSERAAAKANPQTAGVLAERSQSLDRRNEELASRAATLAAAQQQLCADRDAFQTEAQRLAEQRTQLAEERDRHAEAVQQLAERSEAFNAEQEQIARQREEISQLQQRLTQEQERTAQDQARVAQEREQLSQDCQQLGRDREQLNHEQGQLAQDRQQLAGEREQLAAQQVIAQDQAAEQAFNQRREQLAQQEADLRQQLEAATHRLAELGELLERMVDERASLSDRGQRLNERQQEFEARTKKLDQLAEELQARCQERDQQPATSDGQGDAAIPDLASSAQEPGPGDDHAAEVREDLTPSGPIGGGEEPPVNMTVVFQHHETFDSQEQPADSAACDSPVITQADSPPAQSPESAENPDDSLAVSSVLSRLVKSGLWRGEENLQTAASEPAQASNEDQSVQRSANMSEENAPAEVNGTSPSPATGNESADGEEESIESYMDRLMQRVRGDSSSQTSLKPASISNPESSPLPAAAEAPPLPVVESVTEEPGQYSPRRAAPESNSNLSAMRALANSAARQAIDQHVRTRTGKQATGKLFGACSTVVVSLLLCYWAWRAQSLQAAVGAAIGGAVGAYWTLAAIRRLFGLMRLNKELDAQKANPQPLAEPELPAVDSAATP